MRHHYFGRKLNQDYHQRQALFKNLVVALFEHNRIKTTEAKAKAIKPLVDKLITKVKKGTLASRRQVLSQLNNNQEIVEKLFLKIVPVFKNRASGFTRIIKIGSRQGDNTNMVVLELVDKPIQAEEKVAKKKKTSLPEVNSKVEEKKS